MLEKYEQASELYETEEVFDLHFPSCDQPAEVMHPGEEPFDFPAALVAPECSAILGLLSAVDPIGRDHLNAVLAHLLVECIGIISLVADQPRGKFV